MQRTIERIIAEQHILCLHFMVCLRWTEIVLACSAAEDFVSTEHNAGECKIHDIVSLFVSAFTAA